MKQLKLFCCPLCEEVVALYGAGKFECCGASRLPLEVESELTPKVEEVDGECMLTFDIPMTKEHHLVAVVEERYDRIAVTRLFAEQDPVARISNRKGCKVHAIVNKKGVVSLARVNL